MARRTGRAPSRMELRRANEAAEAREGEVAEAGAAPAAEAAAAPPKAKAPKKAAAPKKPSRSKSTKKRKADSQRMRLVWGVFDNSNQQVAAFPYADRAGADKRAEDLTAKGRGPYFVQPVKEPIPLEETAPAES